MLSKPSGLFKSKFVCWRCSPVPSYFKSWSSCSRQYPWLKSGLYPTSCHSMQENASIYGCVQETIPNFSIQSPETLWKSDAGSRLLQVLKKNLGLLLTTNLSWSAHINSVCSKAKKILRLIYRRFYGSANQTILKQLYLSLVRPHLEYACQIWDPI